MQNSKRWPIPLLLLATTTLAGCVPGFFAQSLPAPAQAVDQRLTGARGETQAAMAQALSLQGLSQAEANQANGALQTVLAGNDHGGAGARLPLPHGGGSPVPAGHSGRSDGCDPLPGRHRRSAAISAAAPTRTGRC